MRLSTSTNILCDRPNEQSTISQFDSIRLCAGAGFKILDFCFWDAFTSRSPFAGENWEKYLNDIAQTARENGVVFNQSHAVIYDFCRPDIDHEFMQSLMKRCVVGARMLDIPLLVIHPSTDYSSACIHKLSKEKNVAYISRLAEFSQKNNVELAIENMWDLNISPRRRYASTAEELIDLVNTIGEVGVCWDTEHASLEKQDQGQALRLIGPKLKATHISDQSGLDNIHILPYLGVSDWDEILKALAMIQYQGDLTYEVHHFLNRMPKDLILPSLRYSISIGTHLIDRFQFYCKSGCDKSSTIERCCSINPTAF